MASIAKSDSNTGLRAFSYGAEHPAMALWLADATGLLPRIHAQLQARQAHPARTLVLLPYAQLLPLASRLWARLYPDGFSPRFETTQNWVATTGGRVLDAQDISMDPAVDTLTAQALLAGSGAQGQEALAPLLVQAAYQLAPLAAAAGPAQRATWAQTARVHAGLGMDSQALAWEARVARLAVEWAAVSSYTSDALFDSQWPETLDCLVLVQGANQDALPAGLASVWGDKLLSLPLSESLIDEPPTLSGALALHACEDAEDEAQRTAACLLQHIASDRYPVALVSADRALTRRVRALLDMAGVAVRDENGWKLSTSQAGASVMALLRAAQWNASSDAVLAALKQAPGYLDTLDALEAAVRRDQVRDWRQVATSLAVAKSPALQAACTEVEQLRSALAGRKPLAGWLAALQQTLQRMCLWARLQEDGAGSKLLAVLRLTPADAAQWSQLLGQALWAGQKLDLMEFTRWVNQALEGASFQPDYPDQEQVVIVPLSQMLGRPFAAVVMAGCDEVRLNPSPEPAGGWTPAQRAALGLPSREALEGQLRLVWRHALASPACDVLWRSSDDTGEALQPSALVQQLRLREGGGADGHDPRVTRLVTPQPCLPPQPTGPALAVHTLSASAYEDLRHCPYRFFAQRMLGLRAVDELDAEVDKRDFGLWLHAVLQAFHAALAEQALAESAARSALLDRCSAEVTGAMALPEGEFLPFAAAWPAVRDGYLAWLNEHEAQGAVFASGEMPQRQRIGPVTLIGRTDRTDTLPDGTVMLLDYKTEPVGKTRTRIQDPLEDTQMAFYAALLPHDTLRAAYVNVGERDGTDAYEQKEVVIARDALIDGVQSDMARIAQGAALPALGEGTVCDFCQVRGLCRKDFWEAA
nr:PD-(D/E)XK nuclease family protein [uncultured Rhodoferax sp.]